MLKSLKGARLGIFIFVGSILLILAIFLIGNKDLLFQKTFVVNAYFSNVEGLRKGAEVRLSGIKVGSVMDILITDDPSGKVLVSLRINSNIKNFIKIDTKASIETEGLVGNKLVVLKIGSASASLVRDGGFIKSEDPVSLSQIYEEAQGTLSYVKDITKNFSEIVEKVNQGKGTIGMLINDEGLYLSTQKLSESANTSLNNITEQLTNISDIITGVINGVNSVVGRIDTIMVDVDYMVKNVKKGEGALGLLIGDNSAGDSLRIVIKNLVATSEESKLGAERLAESMEALKHNFLFKSYFEKRGYWEKSEIQKDIDKQWQELEKKNKELDKKILQLKELEYKLNQKID